MVHAFVMVETGPAESEGLVGRIRELAAVVKAHVVAGDYDIIAEVNAPETYDVLRTATTDIQGLEGVATTRTYISLDE